MSQLYECITNGGIAMRVELHRVSHNVCHLIISAVVHTFHGVHDTALYGLETIFNIGYGTLKDYVRSVIQEPILIHAG